MTMYFSCDEIEQMELAICKRHRVPYSRVDRVWLRTKAVRELVQLSTIEPEWSNEPTQIDVVCHD